MFSIFALIAVIFTLLAVGGIVALGYVQYSKKTLKVGDLVKTTFTGSPAVLTTALWGTKGQFGYENVYGPNFSVDQANALHCDMPKGVGIYSTWISDAGMNFKINPTYTNTPLYIFGNACVNDSDCSATSLKCGPGYKPNDPGIIDNVSYPGGQSLWQTNSRNPAVIQCPEASFCDLCGGPYNSNSTNQYCRGIGTDSVGTCKTTEGIHWSCTNVFGSNTQNVCAANIPITPKTPSHKQFESCSINQNFTSLSWVTSTNLGPVTIRCDNPAYANVAPYFCFQQGNVNCLVGQQCVANWGSGPETGWTVPGTVNNQYYTATNVCSGTVFPMVTMQTDWIAEGKISSISGTRYYVDWERVQNTYGGVGPSADSCKNGTCTQPTEQDPFDNSWIYSDCRFVKMDNPGPSRHLSVSHALLGKISSAPSGLSGFSLSDASLTSNVLKLLYVNTSTTGTISNYFANTALPIPKHDEYKPTAWNLSNVYKKEDLSRIFFFSIHPMQATSQTDSWGQDNFSIVRNNLMRTITP